MLSSAGSMYSEKRISRRRSEIGLRVRASLLRRRVDSSNTEQQLIAASSRMPFGRPLKGVCYRKTERTTGWQPHTVRGFVSILGSKAGEKKLGGKRARWKTTRGCQQNGIRSRNNSSRSPKTRLSNFFPQDLLMLPGSQGAFEPVRSLIATSLHVR
jgi:hypothetical protein